MKVYVKLVIVYFLILNVFTIFGAYAQEESRAVKVFTKLTDYYDQENYGLRMKYTLSIAQKGNLKVIEEQNIGVQKNKNSNKIEALGVTMYSDRGFLISVFEKEKQLLLRKFDKNLLGIAMQTKILKSFVTNYDISITSETSQSIFLRLQPKKGVNRQDIHYSSIEMECNKTNYTLKNQKLYVLEAIPVPNNTTTTLGQAVININYEYHKPSELEELPKLSHFVIKKGEKFVGTSVYKDYLIRDEINE